MLRSMVISVTHEEAAIADFHEVAYAGMLSFRPLLLISELRSRRCSPVFRALILAFAAVAAHAQMSTPHPSFEVLTHRMNVDVDGAPNAYGPPGKPALDAPKNAHYGSVANFGGGPDRVERPWRSTRAIRSKGASTREK